MRKSLASRIFGLAFLYCAVFCTLVVLQFSKKGNFSLSTGAMTIRGRYLQAPQEAQNEGSETGWQSLAGGIKLFYGGLEFNLKEEREKGLILADGSTLMPVNPSFMFLTENAAHFSLPGGTTLVFSSYDSARGSELQINAEFAENVSEIVIPISARRSSLISDNGQLGVLYNSGRYFLNSPGNELETGKLVLSIENSSVSYRSREDQRVFDPADYIIPQEQNYRSALALWQEASFAHWNQNPSLLQNDDDVSAYCSEALRQGNFTAAVRSISASFLNSSRHTYRSAGFTGGMTSAYRSFASAEREKTNLIAQLTRERSLDILKEDHIIDYLFTRGNTALANDVIALISSTGGGQIIPLYCPGILEAYVDIKRWRQANNPAEPLIEQTLSLISKNLNRDTEKDLVYASLDGNNDLEFNVRLGIALVNWAQDAGNTEWAAVGRSLILSALTAGGAAGNLYSILRPAEYYHRASWLSDNGLWAWTVSPSARASYTNGNLNITVSFPTSMSHYLIIQGVSPFIKMQLHDTDWRTDNQFENYDSSGWIYYPQDQILIVKLRHRAAVETVRVIYRAEEPPVIMEENNADTETGENTVG
jgi:hypothetical protein